MLEGIDAKCVACNQCIDVCPVENCIDTMALKPGPVDAPPAKVVQKDCATWTTHPSNPMATAAAQLLPPFANLALASACRSTKP